jgi:hypothetical protein
MKGMADGDGHPDVGGGGPAGVAESRRCGGRRRRMVEVGARRRGRRVRSLPRRMKVDVGAHRRRWSARCAEMLVDVAALADEGGDVEIVGLDGRADGFSHGSKSGILPRWRRSDAGSCPAAVGVHG